MAPSSISPLEMRQTSGVTSAVISSLRAVCSICILRIFALKSHLCTAYENSKITTYSHPDAFPSSLRQKRKTRTKVHEGSDALLKVTACDLFQAEFIEYSTPFRSPRRVQSAATWKLTRRRSRLVLGIARTPSWAQFGSARCAALTKDPPFCIPYVS